MPLAIAGLSNNQTQIGLFVAGAVGASSVPTGALLTRPNAAMSTKDLRRKASGPGDPDWTDTSEGETDEARNAGRSRSKTKIPQRDCKMVLLVRTDLEMGKGKMAAQCAHAAVGAFEEAVDRRDRFLKSWQKYGQAKIALKVTDEETLLALAFQAKSAGLNTYVVKDAGRTQIAAGSITVAAIGPAPIEAIDRITGHLKLL
ncbi:putative Peptidyl-tRNA hydrolase 2, mitochondrial [Hypsibius exemplaris]|uniref:peptidyl-tRNA hydrolase n=1 Tax=Hypsibius exemplaris TaxID=2072580 RepID=A0A1W0X8J9_HYPEX|nr:putative Peptidyl-tRNA hydrolase 2, mitochondrial [Hypsibius exemplaris]